VDIIRDGTYLILKTLLPSGAGLICPFGIDKGNSLRIDRFSVFLEGRSMHKVIDSGL
jgi:hypothetical protein